MPGKLLKEVYVKTYIDSDRIAIYYGNEEIKDLWYDKNGIVIRKTEDEYILPVLDRTVSSGQFNSNRTGTVFSKRNKLPVKKRTGNLLKQHRCSLLILFLLYSGLL
jgi:hypothetical protein